MAVLLYLIVVVIAGAVLLLACLIVVGRRIRALLMLWGTPQRCPCCRARMALTRSRMNAGLTYECRRCGPYDPLESPRTARWTRTLRPPD